MLQFAEIEWQIVERERERMIRQWRQTAPRSQEQERHLLRRWLWRRDRRAEDALTQYVRSEWTRPLAQSSIGGRFQRDAGLTAMGW